ncbi:MAG: type III-B CRISPR module RAMP protein Cmr4 [Nitrososphaerales archaeon]
MDDVYVRKTYFSMAIDPIHVGTGGYTLGRADNPILRDFDGVPKIPGTSIEGTARTYAYFQGLALKRECAKGKKDACGQCKVCVSFGYTGEERSQQGLAIFSDAKVLFFPVASLVGPVWITSPGKLKELGIQQDTSIWENFDKSESCIVSNYLKNKLKNVGYLNFGWLLLYLEKEGDQLATHNISTNTIFGEDKLSFAQGGLDKKDVFDRLVIVSDSVFSQIVNSNLEVRTSVSISPETGAAEEGALFTYEAIPRGTILQFTMVYQNPKHFDVAGKNLEDIISTVETSFELLEFLGVGGMGTRGFGKLKVFGLDKRYDPIKLAQIRVDTMRKRLEEIDQIIKSASDEEQTKLEKEKREILEEMKQAREKYKQLVEIYEKAAEGG